jgi:hypothetical protein
MRDYVALLTRARQQAGSIAFGPYRLRHNRYVTEPVERLQEAFVPSMDEIETVQGIHNVTMTGNEAQVIKELYDLYKMMNAKNFLEYYHDALEHKEELFTLFDLGFIGLEDRAKGEILFHHELQL